MTEIKKLLKKIILLILTLIITFLITGYTFSVLWNLFIVPFDFRHINLFESMGVILFFQFIKGWTEKKNKMDYEDYNLKYFCGIVYHSFLWAVISLSLGRIIYIFI